MKTLGVIGGLGPMATAYFMELVTNMTDAASDQEHLDILIFSRPRTPDRTGYILGRSSENPLPVMADSARHLAADGAQVLAIPCNTAHYFHTQVQEAAGVPVLHMIRESDAYLKACGIEKAGIMATDGTIQTGLYQKELEANGIAWTVPSETCQQHVMHLIYENVKAGRPAEMERFHAVNEELQRDGAQAVLMACTELSVIKKQFDLGSGILDALEVLAKTAVEACDAPLREEYRNLITG